LVSTTTGGSFVEMLRKRMVLMTLGALRLTGLEATLAVPVQTGAATGYWLATEGTTITESQQTFAQMSLTPKTVGAYTEISDKLLKQSSASAEMIVTRDLAAVLAVAADAAGLVGSGASGEPTGIINTSGIGSVTGTSLDYDKALEFQSDVLGQNALISRDACGYITTTAVAKLLANRQRFTGVDSPLWQGNLAGHRGRLPGVFDGTDADRRHALRRFQPAGDRGVGPAEHFN
jgi:HK97 family phage major capsid protein